MYIKTCLCFSAQCKRRFPRMASSISLFFSYLSNRSDPEWYEVQFVVKDYCFGRTDRLVSSTVLTLSQALDLGGSAPLRLPLWRGSAVSEAGATVLRILSQRVASDEVAREFVRVKSEVVGSASGAAASGQQADDFNSQQNPPGESNLTAALALAATNS